jgi:hypothetical protein
VICGAAAVSSHPAESIVLTYLALDLTAVWFTCAVTMSDGGLGGAPAADVDHGVFARLNRFKVNENLVINMIWAWRLRTGRGVP